MMKAHLTLVRVGVSVLAFTAANAAHAQATTAAPAGTQPAQSSPPEPSTSEATGVSAEAVADQGAGDIIVTANKREQNLNKVGASIAAFGAEQLETRRVATVADLALVTPGLTFAPTPDATPVYTLRGVGFYESSLAAYPDVSLYIDQVPLSLPVMSTLTAFDLERVEVLKGPQGTLFGNNATGGAINLVAAKPLSTTSGGLEVGIGRFLTLESTGYLTGALTPTMNARIAFKAQKSQDGWQRSYTRDDELGKRENYAGRLLIDWTPTSTLKFQLNVNGWVDKNEPQAPQKIFNAPQFPTPPVFPQASYPSAPSNNRAADWGPFRPFADTTFWQTALRGDLDLGFATLTSLSSYSRTRFLNATEGSGTALEDLDLNRNFGRIRSFTQELRLANDPSNSFRWVLGGNYERTTVFQETALYYRDTSATAANGIVNSTYKTNQKMRNYAGFANVEFDVTDQVTLKGGIRRTRAERNLSAINSDDPRYPNGINPFTGMTGLSLTQFFNFVYGLVYQGAVPTIAPFGSIILDTRTNADGTPVNPDTFLTTSPLNDRLRENSTSWSVGVDFKPTDNILIYANIARGFKAGSFPHLSGSIYTAYQNARQEKLTDYEGGIKVQLFDRKVSLNAAAFYYDYRDKQLRAKFVDPIFGALDLLVNVPKSRITGAEASIDARPFPGLTLSASGTYLDAEVVNYTGVVGSTPTPLGLVPVTASFKGVRLPYAPKLQYAFRADYDFPLSASMNAFAGVGVNGQTKSTSTLALPGASAFGVPSNLYEVNARALVDANIGIHAADDSWKVTIWGKNIFDKYHWTSVTQTYDAVVRYAGRPAEYGITAGFKF